MQRSLRRQAAQPQYPSPQACQLLPTQMPATHVLVKKHVLFVVYDFDITYFSIY
jgi:hypothetical protein